MEDSCEHYNELSGSIICRIIIMMIMITTTLQINDITLTAEISKFKSLTAYFFMLSNKGFKMNKANFYLC